MSEDETIVTVAALILGPLFWIVWVWQLSRARRVRAGGGASVIGIAGLISAAIIYAVLVTGASADVREAPLYLFMYVVLGLAWVRIVEPLFTLAGMSIRDDVIERRNRAALLAALGALVGVTLCYAGGNIGNGPGWWVVVFSAGLATFTFMVAWALYERLTNSSDVIAIDRDPSAGLRLGAFLIACGLLFGRGVAGDWVSVEGTVRDFVVVLPPVIPLLAVGWLVERTAKPTPERPRAPLIPYGIGPALVYVGIAAAFVVRLGSSRPQ